MEREKQNQNGMQGSQGELSREAKRNRRAAQVQADTMWLLLFSMTLCSVPKGRGRDDWRLSWGGYTGRARDSSFSRLRDPWLLIRYH